MRLLAATNNGHKLLEIKRILTPLGIEVVSPADLGVNAEIEETGETFAENARIKAEAMYKLTGMPAVADDSGLAVDALNGRPGVYSARYMGDAPQAEKNAALLKELESVPEERRAARFVAAICCMLDKDTVIVSEGICEGTIAWGPSGNGGFGYDPIFLVKGKSFAALTGDEKDALSHRGLALREFAGKLSAYIISRENNS